MYPCIILKFLGWKLLKVKQIINTIFKVGDRNNSFEDYLSDLHQKDGEAEDCRYGLYDYEYKYNPDGAESTFKSKIFLMSWCPDSSRIKKKMLYSSRFDFSNLLNVCSSPLLFLLFGRKFIRTQLFFYRNFRYHCIFFIDFNAEFYRSH